jgi:hypothetical protein
LLPAEKPMFHRRAATGVAVTQTLDTVDRPRARPTPASPTGSRDSGAVLAPWWVGGVAVLCLLLAFVITGPLTAISARAEVWVPYLVLGTLFPLVVAAVVLRQRSGRALPAWLGIVLTALPIVAIALVAGARHSVLALGLALMQTLICLVLLGRLAMPVRLEMANLRFE